jgi:hypothetical protein
MWQQAFFKLAAAAGVPVDPSQAQPPEAVIEQAQAARHRDPWVQVGRPMLHKCSISSKVQDLGNHMLWPLLL